MKSHRDAVIIRLFVSNVGEMTNTQTYNILIRNPEEKRLIAQSRRRWKDSIKMNRNITT
jgi:hypothetical protein